MIKRKQLFKLMFASFKFHSNVCRNIFIDKLHGLLPDIMKTWVFYVCHYTSEIFMSQLKRTPDKVESCKIGRKLCNTVIEDMPELSSDIKVKSN